MCRVMIMAGIKPEKNKQAVKFIELMGRLMTPGNTDGLGYAAVDKDGNLFGERWLENDHAFVRPEDVPVIVEPPVVQEMIDALGTSVKLDTVAVRPTLGPYGTFGTPDLSKAVAITLHTRAATSEKGYKNIHPFFDVEADTSLIHNGIIRNEDEFKLELSTCDSESILISYLRQGVNKNIKEASAMSKELIGYYACGVFSRDAEGNRILDYFKGNQALLHASYIYELETFVITTSAYTLREACGKLGFTHSNIWSIAEGWIVRLDPVTGKLIAKEQFTVGHEFLYQANKTLATTARKTWETWEEWQAKKSAKTTPVLPSAKKENLTKEMIEYMKIPPSCHVYSINERKEFMQELREMGDVS